MLQCSTEKALKKVGFSPFPNDKVIFCLEVFINFEEDFKISIESLLGHIVWLLVGPEMVGSKDIPGSNLVFTRKDKFFTFLHDQREGPVFPGAFHLFVIFHCTSLSLVH